MSPGDYGLSDKDAKGVIRSVPPLIIEGDPSAHRRIASHLPFQNKHVLLTLAWSEAAAVVLPWLSTVNTIIRAVLCSGFQRDEIVFSGIAHAGNGNGEEHAILTNVELHKHRRIAFFSPPRDRLLMLILQEALNFERWTSPCDVNNTQRIELVRSGIKKADWHHALALVRQVKHLEAEEPLNSRAELIALLNNNRLPVIATDKSCIAVEVDGRRFQLTGPMCSEKFTSTHFLFKHAFTRRALFNGLPQDWPTYVERLVSYKISHCVSNGHDANRTLSTSYPMSNDEFRALLDAYHKGEPSLMRRIPLLDLIDLRKELRLTPQHLPNPHHGQEYAISAGYHSRQLSGGPEPRGGSGGAHAPIGAAPQPTGEPAAPNVGGPEANESALGPVGAGFERVDRERRRKHQNRLKCGDAVEQLIVDLDQAVAAFRLEDAAEARGTGQPIDPPQEPNGQDDSISQFLARRIGGILCSRAERTRGNEAIAGGIDEAARAAESARHRLEREKPNRPGACTDPNLPQEPATTNPPAVTNQRTRSVVKTPRPIVSSGPSL